MTKRPTTGRPVCVHCGARYGRKAYTTEVVRWDAPSQRVNTNVGVPSAGFVQTGEIPLAPPYRGNGVVIHESSPYVSAEDGRAIMHRRIWDGESWWTGYDPFCTLRCALDYARKAYEASKRATLTRIK